MPLLLSSSISLSLSLTVEVEGPLAGDGAVEPRLEERGPLVAEFVRAARVVFADAGHAGEDGLEGRSRRKKHEKEERDGWLRVLINHVLH